MYKTKSCSVFKSVESHGSLSKSPSKWSLNFNMLYNGNFTLYIFLYKKCLLFGVYKYLIYRFYISGEFVPWYFAKVQKLGFAVICIETYRSVTQKEMFCLNL